MHKKHPGRARCTPNWIWIKKRKRGTSWIEFHVCSLCFQDTLRKRTVQIMDFKPELLAALSSFFFLISCQGMSKQLSKKTRGSRCLWTEQTALRDCPCQRLSSYCVSIGFLQWFTGRSYTARPKCWDYHTQNGIIIPKIRDYHTHNGISTPKYETVGIIIPKIRFYRTVTKMAMSKLYTRYIPFFLLNDLPLSNYA